MNSTASIRQAQSERIRLLKKNNPIEDVIGKVTKLSGGEKRRGTCPLHGSKSASLAVDIKKQTATCWGCQWRGDVIEFVMAHQGVDFVGAIEHLGGGPSTGSGLTGNAKVLRERNPAKRRAREIELVDSFDAGRWIWGRAHADVAAARRYFLGRGVPGAVLSDARLREFRFIGECPLMAWEKGGDPLRSRNGSVLHNPALVALIRVPMLRQAQDSCANFVEFVPTGCHVTYLSPDGSGSMRRRRPWAKPDDDDPHFPKRKMFGASKGGCVLLGEYAANAPLFIGEGNETVLSGMFLQHPQDRSVDHAPDAVGVATLSLDTLQGRPVRWKGGVLPLFDIKPDPQAPPFVIAGHRGPVTGLIDSDMSPLKGPIVPSTRSGQTPVYRGMPLVERKGGPIVNRWLTGAERARICGELVVKGWRAAGVSDVTAVRAPMGKDFNDVAAERMAAT